MSERLWTIEEANLALARVTEAIGRARDAVRRASEHAEARAERVSSNGHGDEDDATATLNEVIRDLDDDGIVVRDLDRGLVDFPARSPSGRPYWLCWVVGESAVEWWHWPEDGFAGRTSITEPPA